MDSDYYDNTHELFAAHTRYYYSIYLSGHGHCQNHIFQNGELCATYAATVFIFGREMSPPRQLESKDGIKLAFHILTTYLHLS